MTDDQSTAPGRVFLHIGAPKTGSTTLQRRLFARHPQILYFGEDGDGWDTREAAAVAEKLLHSDDMFFPAEQCAAHFAAKRKQAGNRVLIYSNADVMGSRHPASCANRLHGLLPDAEVIVILRNQFTALASFWANHGAFLKPAPPGHFRRFVELEDWLAWGAMFPEETPFANFLYGEIIDLYARLWGKNRVHVMLFEDFVSNADGFIHRLADLLGIRRDEAIALARGGHERPRNSARALAWHRLHSRFFWRCSLPRRTPGREVLQRAWLKFLSGGPPARVEIPEAWRSRVAAIYAPGNAHIAREWGLDLARHGYPLPRAFREGLF